MVWICIALVGVSLALSLPLSLALVRAGHRLGLLDPIGSESHKRHDLAVPNTGGIGIFAAVAVPMAVALLAVWLLPQALWDRTLPAISVHLSGLRRMTATGGVVLCSMAAMHLVGLIDDRRALDAAAKLFAQALVAAALVGLGDMRVLAFLDQIGWWGTAVSAAVSWTWIVVIINAFNFLDNMDGLSGGVAAIIAALYLAATLIGQQWFVAALAALLLGALLGFLLFNFPPAKIFMGDGGSLVVGLLLAVISIRTTYFITPEIEPWLQDVASLYDPGRWYGVLMPLMVMAVPLYDFISVTVIRLSLGHSPFRGDHNHFSHRLVALGLSRRRAVLVIWLMTLATGISGVMLGSLEQWQAVLAATQTLAILAMLAVLEHGALRPPARL